MDGNPATDVMFEQEIRCKQVCWRSSIPVYSSHKSIYDFYTFQGWTMLKRSWTASIFLFFIISVLWGPLISRFLEKIKFRSDRLFSVLFLTPSSERSVWICVSDCSLRSKHPLLWLANSCVCLTTYVLHRWTLLWFRLNMHNYSYQTICLTDKAIVINKPGTASSFSFNLSENPATNFALF